MHEHITVNNTRAKNTDRALNWIPWVFWAATLSSCFRRINVVPSYPQDNETVYWITLNALLFRGELVFGALLFLGEGNRWCTVLKKTGALLFSWVEHRSSTVLKRTGAVLFSGEGNRWSTVFMSRYRSSTVLKRTGALYCFHEKENVSLLFWIGLVHYLERKGYFTRITGETVIFFYILVFLWNLKLSVYLDTKFHTDNG